MNRNKLQQARFTKIWSDETGAATAEYAIATMAAVGFAGLLVVIMRSDEVRTILFDLVRSALTFTNPNDSATDPVAP
jgi:Flp pilus assembly pilin Flp